MDQRQLAPEERARYRSKGIGRVLLAEDDDELRDAFRVALERGGFAVLTAADGREMLGLLSAVSSREIELPDVVVMDVRMPWHSGVELLLALRLAEWQLPVVLVTGFVDERASALACELGALDVLEKPVTSVELVRAVHRAVALSRQPLGGARP